MNTFEQKYDKLFGSTSGPLVLFCPACEARNSAHIDDYFQLSPDHIMKCECEELMILVREIKLIQVMKSAPIVVSVLPNQLKGEK